LDINENINIAFVIADFDQQFNPPPVTAAFTVRITLNIK